MYRLSQCRAGWSAAGAMVLLAAAVGGAATPDGARRPALPGVIAHLAATDVEVRNGGRQALNSCRLSLDHRIASGAFDLPAGAVRRISLEDFHVEPSTMPPSEVQFTYLFLECREGGKRFTAG